MESIRTGRNLSDPQVQQLERELIDDQSNLNNRISLISYYYFGSLKSPDAEASFGRHALWIIENEPEHRIAGMGFTMIDETVDPAGYAKSKEIWKKHVAANPTNAVILGNAARHVSHGDRELAETYLLKAREVEPDNPEWPERLGLLYMRASESTLACSKALRSFEEAFTRRFGSARYNALASVGQAAFCANEIEKARRYAHELLDAAMEQQGGWNFGNAVYYGNTILGRIAAQEGNIVAAELHLIRAGGTPGSPQLNTGGLDMKLARDLIKLGRDSVVLEYFDLCKTFWTDPKLDAWITDVKENRMPDFGTHIE